MDVSAADAAYSYGLPQTGAASKDNAISTEDFFALLAAQLQNQSMYDTVDNTEFISQMMQFTSLSQMQELTSGLQMAYSVSLIGKNVTILATDETGVGRQVAGSVESVVYDGGVSYVCVGGCYYATDSIVGIREGSGAADGMDAIREAIREAAEEIGETIGERIGRESEETGEETVDPVEEDGEAAGEAVEEIEEDGA